MKISPMTLFSAIVLGWSLNEATRKPLLFRRSEEPNSPWQKPWIKPIRTWRAVRAALNHLNSNQYSRSRHQPFPVPQYLTSCTPHFPQVFMLLL